MVLRTLFLFAGVRYSLCLCSPLVLPSIRPPVVHLHVQSRIHLTQGRRENWKTRALVKNCYFYHQVLVSVLSDTLGLT